MVVDSNPILAEIANLSPGAQAALLQAHSAAAGTTTPPAGPPPPAPMQAPGTQAPQIAPPLLGQQKAVAAEPAAAASMSAPMTAPAPSMGTPALSNETSKTPTQERLLRDQTELGRKVDTGSGISQIMGKVQGALPNHPLLGKILGGTAQGLATLGDVGLSAVAPEVAINLPSTEYHHQALVNQGNSQVRTDEANAEREAQTGLIGANTSHLAAETAGLPGEQSDKHNLTGAQIGNLDSEAYAHMHPQSAWKELPGYAGPNGEPLEIDEKTGQTRVAPGETGAKTSKVQNPQEKTYDALLKSGMTPIQAYEKIREKPPGTTNVGTWAIDEDKDGKPIMFNSKTGETRAAPGVQKAGTKAKADAAVAPVQAALDYANDYVPRTVHTGPGDEALMEKFFELAKPSTGFRMSQQQIDMLKDAQSWMGGIEAHIRHAAVGTWFSDEQRKEIMDTMGDLGKAKGLGPKAEGGGAGGGGEAPEGFKVQMPDGSTQVKRGGKWVIE